MITPSRRSFDGVHLADTMHEFRGNDAGRVWKSMAFV
jgi:hypothetical protein